MKNSNWIFLLSMIALVAESIFWFAGKDTLFLGSVYVALICTYFVIKELEKLNDTKSRKKSDEFAKKTQEETIEQWSWELAKQKFEEKCNYKPNLSNQQDLLVVSSIQEGILIGSDWQQEQDLLMHEKQKDKLVFESLHKTYEANKYSLAIAFGDWLKYESVCFPEHKDKSIEELLEIYKKSL
jgi:hypothetical protein